MAARQAEGSRSCNSNIFPTASSATSSLRDVTLMLLGKTGAGKSSLGNAILNLSGMGAFNVTHGLYATDIYEAVVKDAYVYDRIVKVVDTPGVMDTSAGNGDSDEKALQGICDGISRCSEGVDAFLIVLRLDAKFTDEERKKSIAKLERLLGPHFWRHAILVVTHGDSVQNDASTFKKRLAEAKDRVPEFKELMSKLRTKPQMVDARVGIQPGVVTGQMKDLMNTVDMLVAANKKKYTNDLFAIARAELATKKNAELEKELKDAKLQLLTFLQEEVSDLKSQREKDRKKMDEDKKMMETLERRALEAENMLKASQAQAAGRVKELGGKKCLIL